MTGIRVLRIIEYVYDTPERAADDMGRWTNNLNLPHQTMKSTALPFETIEWNTQELRVEPDATTDLMELRAHGLDLAALRVFKNSTKLDIYVREDDDDEEP